MAFGLIVCGVPLTCCLVMLFAPYVRDIPFENDGANQLLTLTILFFVLGSMILADLPFSLLFWMAGISIAAYVIGGWKGRTKLRNFTMFYILAGTFFLFWGSLAFPREMWAEPAPLTLLLLAAWLFLSVPTGLHLLERHTPSDLS